MFFHQRVHITNISHQEWMPWLLVNLHCKSTQHLQLLTTMPMFIYIVIDYQNEQWHRYHWKSVICSHHEGFMKGFIGRKNYSGSQEVKNLVLLSLVPSPGDWNISLSALLQFWSSDISEAKLLVLTGKKVAFEVNSHPPHVHLRNKWAQVFFAALLLLRIILNEQKQTKKNRGRPGNEAKFGLQMAIKCAACSWCPSFNVNPN